MTSTPKAKILIVDDEEEIVTFLAGFLKEEGFPVLTAQDGITALAEIERERPEIVLLDLNIPKMSGFQILERIKPKETGVRVLIFSGIAAPEEKKRALALGAWTYLSKPVQIDTLLAELQRVT